MMFKSGLEVLIGHSAPPANIVLAASVNSEPAPTPSRVVVHQRTAVLDPRVLYVFVSHHLEVSIICPLYFLIQQVQVADTHS